MSPRPTAEGENEPSAIGEASGCAPCARGWVGGKNEVTEGNGVRMPKASGVAGRGGWEERSEIESKTMNSVSDFEKNFGYRKWENIKREIVGGEDSPKRV